MNRLATHRGLALGSAATPTLPRPEDLSTTESRSLRSLDFSGAKTRELIQLAREVTSGQLDLESFADLGNEEAIRGLLDLPGVVRWTAEYVILRGMGRVDVFPSDDIGARNNLARCLKLRKPLDYQRVTRLLDEREPYGGLIYLHLLLDRLERGRAFAPGHSRSEGTSASCMIEAAQAYTWLELLNNGQIEASL